MFTCGNHHNGNGICSSSNSNSISYSFIFYHFLHAFMTKFVIEKNVKVFNFQGAFNKNNRGHFHSIHLHLQSSDAGDCCYLAGTQQGLPGAGAPPRAHRVRPRPPGGAWVLGAKGGGAAPSSNPAKALVHLRVLTPSCQLLSLRAASHLLSLVCPPLRCL